MRLRSSKQTLIPEKLKFDRIRRQIQTDLSPKFTEMKTSGRASRFGRPQKIAQQDANSIPSEITKFISKHSPKRLKPKEQVEPSPPATAELQKSSESEIIPARNDKENLSNGNNNLVEVKPEMDEKAVIDFTSQATSESLDFKIKSEPCESFPTSLLTGHVPSEAQSDAVSDTDSALGSAGSCNGKEEDFVAGQILWGGFSKESWWPCIVCPIDETGAVTYGELKCRLRALKVKTC